MKTPRKQPVEIQTYQFSSLPSLGDRILIFTRSHVFYLWKKISIIAILTLASSLLVLTVFSVLYFSPLLFFFSFTLIVTLGLTLAVNEYLGWYFHFYLVTSRKIVEVNNKPFGNYFINEILLDRVKCTEVDIQSRGILNQILRIGDVIVTFDRPTQHRDSFVFENVSNSNSIREILTDYFSENRKETATWYIQDRRDRGLIYPIDEISIPKLHA